LQQETSSLFFTQSGSTDDPFQPHGLNPIHRVSDTPFLFACLGLVIAQMAGKDRFTFYENGVVSMNPPVSGDIVGGRATRTTHPRVLRGLERVFSLLLEREILIDTPLQWMTKPEVVLLIKTAGMSDLLPMTCSCTRTHQRSTAQPHCGDCSQCMARAQGARAQMALTFETIYGTAPAGGYFRIPFASSSLGAEQPLLNSELLG
jgi:queuosine biosynthesis protein QueC